MEPNNTRDQLDVLRHIETLAEQMNAQMNARSKSILRRYPLTFALLALFGIVAVSEGAKGILEDVAVFKEHPLLMLVVGIVVLTTLGSLYKKLEK
ncbi:MAG: hypothetical protein KBD16_01570 [Candidatus Pacebacteria bacterium]|nr:hypothetical protein [Candidatus Paceibacterota bacterium]